MMSCRRAAELISADLDGLIVFHQRAGLGLHTLVCTSCRRLKVQLGAVDDVVGRYFATAQPVVLANMLPDAAKEQLKAVIDQHLNDIP